MTIKALPYSSTRCYACDAASCGVRDRRPEGGMLEAACARHRDTSLAAFVACAYCCGPRPTFEIERTLVHRKCYRADVAA